MVFFSGKDSDSHAAFGCGASFSWVTSGFFVAFMTLTLLKITGEYSLQTVTQFGLMFPQKQIHSGLLLKKYHTVHQCSCQSDEQVLICPDTADIPFDPLIKRCF